MVLGLVVPGFVYQVSAQTVAGPDPGQGAFGTRVLRAIVSTAAFASGYAVVFGPTVVGYVRDPDSAFADVPTLGSQFVVLALLVPWSAAYAFGGLDAAWVRVLLPDGRWLGGWYGEHSFASATPSRLRTA